LAEVKTEFNSPKIRTTSITDIRMSTIKNMFIDSESTKKQGKSVEEKEEIGERMYPAMTAKPVGDND